MFKKIVIVLSALVALSACGDQANTSSSTNKAQIGVTQKVAADKYWFAASDFSSNRAVITVVRHRNNESLLAAYNAIPNDVHRGNPLPASWTLKGFTVYSEKNGISTCEMHIIDPRIKYEPEFIGHELTHCLHGNFHPYR